LHVAERASISLAADPEAREFPRQRLVDATPR
jgi:hypothetical protein